MPIRLLVDRTDIRPLLGRKACIGMKIVSYLNNKLNKPNTGDAPVSLLDMPIPVSTQQLVEKYPTVLSEGVGLLEAQYHFRLDDSIHQVQHAPRCILVSLGEALKRTLEEMAQQGIKTEVEAQVKQRIFRGEFVEFDILLLEVLYPTKRCKPLPIFLIAPVHELCSGGHGNRAAQAHTSPGWRPVSLLS